MSETLTVLDLSIRIGITTAQIYYMAANGTLPPPVRASGRKMCWTVESVQEYENTVRRQKIAAMENARNKFLVVAERRTTQAEILSSRAVTQQADADLASGRASEIETKIKELRSNNKS